MNTTEEMISIKEMMQKIGIEPDHLMRIEYRKCGLFLKQFVLKTEKKLMKLQETENDTESIKSTLNVLNQLILCHNKFHEMEAKIYELKEENSLLNERLKARE